MSRVKTSKPDKAKMLMKNILLFFIGSFVPKTVSFFLVPLYTGCLTTAEYGTIDLIAVTIQLLMPFFTLQVQDAVLRFSMDREIDPSSVFSSGLRITSAGFGVILVGTLVGYLCGLVRLEWEYVLYFLVSFAVGSLTNIFSYFLRAVQRISTITISALINSGIAVSCNLIFLLCLGWGWKGYLAANTIGSFAAVVFMLFHGRLYTYVALEKPSRSLMRHILSFSIPMVASALSWWANNSLDKYILTYFCGVGTAGILAAAYKIPSILSVLGTTISKGFSISAIENFNDEESDGFLGETYSIVCFFMTAACSAIMLLNIPISKFLFAKDFFAAWKLTPPLLFATLMSFMSLMCEQVFVALKQTRFISVTAIFGALLNASLNFLWIPMWEAYGAAIATAISFFTVWAIRFIVMKRRTRIKTRTLNELVGYLLLIFQVFCTMFGNRFAAMQAAVLAAIVFVNARTISKFMKRLEKR